MLAQPSQEDPGFSEDVCELLTEILSILYKVINRLSVEHAQLIHDVVVKESVLNELQLLLGVKHSSVLLRCTFECILTLFEWIDFKKDV